MKRTVLVVAVALILCLGAARAEAFIWGTDYPFTADFTTIYDRFSWDGFNHLNLTKNATRATASATELSPDGIPNVYYWADYFPTFYDLYISFDGFNWFHYGAFFL